VKPTIGRIVHYQLGASDLIVIDAIGKRARAAGGYLMPYHVGDLVPAMVVRAWPADPDDDLTPLVNLRGKLDGSLVDDPWWTSKAEGAEPGTWQWPARS
jgi:hypothetical protein